MPIKHWTKLSGEIKFKNPWWTFDEIEEKIQTNVIYDGMTMASWALVRNWLISTL